MNFHKSKLLIFLVVFIFAIIFLGAASATNTTVTPGSDAIKTAITNAHPGDTLNLKAGTYYEHDLMVDKDLTITGPITGKNPPSAVIDAQQKGRVFHINTGVKVTLTNLQIENGSASYGGAVDNEGNLNINYCTFKNNRANPYANDRYGGAIYNNGILTLDNSNFANNIAVPTNLWPYGYGGAVDNEGTLSMNYCTFTNNTSTGSTSGGGAVYSKGPLNINNCIFNRNIGVNGGAVFTENRGDSGNIYLPDYTLTIKRSTFTGNIANYEGSAIYNGIFRLNILDSSFIQGSAHQGAVFNVGRLTITGCTFTSNTAPHDNVAWFNGGAIYNSNGTIDINKSNFKGNTADNGGAIYNGATCNIYNSIFTGNKAINREGGAIYNKNTCKIYNATFSSNIAYSGSAIINYGTLNVVNGCNFVGNNANNHGGAIDNDGVIGNIENSKFTKNTAKTLGGAIYNVNSIVNVIKCSFTDNRAINAGGAIFNYVDTFIIQTCTFTGNTAKNGGAIFISMGGNSIKNSNFINNKANYCGGAVYNYHGVFIVYYSKFIGNSASNYGGTIFNDQQHSYCNVIGCILTKSVAKVGSAIYTKSILLNAHFNSIWGNIGSYDIYNALLNNLINLKLNWWGTNFQGSNPIAAKRVNGNIIHMVSPWIILKIGASNTIKPRGISIITANLLYDSNGKYHSPSNGHLIDGIPIKYKTSLGKISSTVNTLNGSAKTKLSIGNNTKGIIYVTATLNQATVKKSIIIV